MELFINTDGGSRGNPGESAIGFVVCDKNGSTLVRIGKRIGVATNNIAEYTAVLEALSWVTLHKDLLSGVSQIAVSMDSQLLQRQLTGLYKIKSPHLRELLFAIRVKEQEIGKPVTYRHVNREQNKSADLLVNQALDNKS